MPVRLRVIPSTHPSAAKGKAPTAERSVEFPDDITEIRIGRRQDLELPLPFSILSGVHAKLVRAKGPSGPGWFLEDLGSRNGTFLAGVRLPPPPRGPGPSPGAWSPTCLPPAPRRARPRWSS